MLKKITKRKRKTWLKSLEVEIGEISPVFQQKYKIKSSSSSYSFKSKSMGELLEKQWSIIEAFDFCVLNKIHMYPKHASEKYTFFPPK